MGERVGPRLRELEWALGCVNSPPRPEGGRRRDSRNLGPTLLPSPINRGRRGAVFAMCTGMSVKDDECRCQSTQISISS